MGVSKRVSRYYLNTPKSSLYRHVRIIFISKLYLEFFFTKTGLSGTFRQHNESHKRDLEKMQLASSLKQSEQYFQSICLRISNLMDDSQEEKVKQEIAQMYAMFDKEVNKEN